MRKSKGFTLIELLVVIAIIAILMGILMPVLSKIRKQAKAAACQGSLHQWTLIWSMYTSENDGFFHQGRGGESQDSRDRWPAVMRRMYGDDKMRLCPMASKPQSEGGLNPYSAWGVFSDRTLGSYGLNEWVLNRGSNTAGGQANNYWQNIDNIKPTSKVPIFLDCVWYDVWVHSVDQPPQTDGATGGWAGSNEIRRVCLNRHQYAVNVVFADWSHRNYDTHGPWTLASRVNPDRWPKWMKALTDY
jgi:prepilin-type N-terminal cleavage/methylation domain-containing protein